MPQIQDPKHSKPLRKQRVGFVFGVHGPFSGWCAYEVGVRRDSQEDFRRAGRLP